MEGSLTCQSIGEIEDQKTNVVENNKNGCEKRCNGNIECKFYSFDAKNSCKVFRSCEKFQPTEETNFVFEKTSNGSNIRIMIFFLIFVSVNL